MEKVSEMYKKEIEESEYSIIGCTVNNEYRNLQEKVSEKDKVELISIASKEGMKMYRRTLVYIACKAVEELYSPLKLYVNYQLANAMYCNIDGIENTVELIKNIENKMHEIVEADMEIKKIVMNREEADEFYKTTGTSKGKLQYELKENKEISMYYCEIIIIIAMEQWQTEQV